MNPCQSCGNIDPIDQEPYRVCQSDSCPDCRIIDALDERVSQVKAQLDELVETRRRFKARINKIHKSIMDQFSPEIVSTIFEFAVENASSSRKDDGALSPLSLGAVCRSWRQIAWSTPTLWTFLRFGITNHTSEVHTDLAIEWLQRSGDMLWHVHFVGRGYKTPTIKTLDILFPLISFLNENSHRWSTLILDVPRTLISRISDAQSGSCQLRRLELGNSESLFDCRLNITSGAEPEVARLGHFRREHLSLKWGKLRYIYALGFDIHDVMEIMKDAQLLEECTFRVVRPTRDQKSNEVPWITTFTCERLTSLEVHLFTSAFNQVAPSVHSFLCNAICPALQICIIDVATRNIPSDAWVTFFQHSGRHMQELSLLNTNLQGEEICKITKKMSSLRKLRLILMALVRDENFKMDFFYRALSNSVYPKGNTDISLRSEEPFLPKLQELELSGSANGLFPSQLIRGLPDSGQISHLARPLKSIKICLQDITSSRTQYIGRQDLVKILKLKADGMDLEFEYRNGFSRREDWIEMSLQRLNEDETHQE